MKFFTRISGRVKIENSVNHAKMHGTTAKNKANLVVKKPRKSGGNLVEAVQLPKTTPNLPKSIIPYSKNYVWIHHE